MSAPFWASARASSPRSRAEPPDPAGDQPRPVQSLADDPPRPARHARDHAHRHHQVRARQGPSEGRSSPARAEADLDPHRDGVRPRVRLPLAFAVVTETIFSWPGMGKLLIDSIAPRPPGDGRLPDPGRAVFITINLRSTSFMRCSIRACAGGRIVTATAQPRAEDAVRLGPSSSPDGCWACEKPAVAGRGRHRRGVLIAAVISRPVITRRRTPTT